MKINLNKIDLEKFYRLLDVKETNIAIASYFNQLCFSMDTFLELKDIDKYNKQDTYNSIFYNYFELDDSNKDNVEITSRYLKDAFRKIDINTYLENPYNKNVKIKDINQNGYKLHYLSYPAYSYFPLEDIQVDEAKYYEEKNILGYMDKEYNFLTLSKNNNIWMCITPNEINTMKIHIDSAKGNVITFGLGLGYYPFMVSLKKEVKKITIIEKDINIINLFKEYLLPYFPNKDKIEIINEDAFKYIERTRLNNYDYAFFDLWHNAEDGLPLYIKINKYNLDIDKSFWIEESLISMYRRCLLTVMEESLSGYNDNDYRHAKNDIDRIINEIYFNTKNIRFNSFKEINDYLSKDNLLKQIKRN